MPLVNALLGAILLFFGRSLYWAFVAVAGFLVGVRLADVALSDQSSLIRILVAVAAGLLGALLAIFAQRVGFALGGLYAGGYLALSLASAAGDEENHLLWFVLGGAIGAILAAILMDWAIIVLSSLVGAGAIVVTPDLAPPVSAILFILLAAAGITVQANRLRARAAVQQAPS